MNINELWDKWRGGDTDDYGEIMNKEDFTRAIAEIISLPVEPPVSQATCGFCKDCKFWDAENAECTNDVICNCYDAVATKNLE